MLLADLHSLYEKEIENPDAKLAFSMTRDEKEWLDNQFKRSGIILSERLCGVPMTIRTFSNHFMFQLMEETVQWMLNGGIFNALFRRHNFDNSENRVENEERRLNLMNELKILSLDDLSFGFYIWLVASGICCLMFVGEILFCFIFKKIKKMFGKLFVFKLLLIPIRIFVFRIQRIT